MNSDKFQLFSIDYPSVKPFVVSIWYGEGKPNPANDFLFSFINELKNIITNGIVINGCHIKIKIRCFICDTPARSLLKCNYFYAYMHTQSTPLCFV